MANYTFNWSNGVTTSIPKPQEQGFHCDYEFPSSAMNNAANEIVAHAGDGDNLNEKEQYCAAAHSWISGLINTSKQIRDKWDRLEIECDEWKCWLCFRSCSCCMDWCYKTENELESAYWSWVPIYNSNLSALASLENIWQETTDQLALDNQQATDQAILDQLIAETNNLISVTAYNNESRELDVAAKKTQKIFIPVLIGLILLGVGFIFLKK
tara:strand:- start:5991 stop:6626 length:636 start_codon:yes stop_codon:yes gene_type:complete